MYFNCFLSFCFILFHVKIHCLTVPILKSDSFAVSYEKEDSRMSEEYFEVENKHYDIHFADNENEQDIVNSSTAINDETVEVVIKNSTKESEKDSVQNMFVAKNTDIKMSSSMKNEALIKLQRLFEFGWSEENPTDRQTKRPQSGSPPQFMTDLYKAVSHSADKQGKPHGASTIRSLAEKDPSAEGLFRFDLSGLSEDEDILEAELHIYRIGLEQNGPGHHPPYYLLRVYQVMPLSRYSFSLHPDVHQLLNVHYISAFSTGWQVFKVKRAVDAWRDGKSPNLGFLVAATSILSEPVEVRFARRGLHGDIYQPTLVLFTKKSNENGNEFINHQIYQRYNIHTHNENTNVLSNQTNHVNSGCQKQSLYVDFERIGWANWIISPNSYSAFKCDGYCSFPIGEDQRPTNHAVVQSVMNQLQEQNVSMPCCVPTKLGPLTLLYYDDYENVVLKTYDDMVVENCGCR